MNKQEITDVIIKMEKAALEEWNRGNPSGYLDIYTQGITYFDPFQAKRIDGFEKMKSLYESLRGTSSVNKYEMIDPVVQISGEMAVLSYNLVSYSGQQAYQWNCTEVYQLDLNNQWKIIHNHWSFIQPLGF